MYSILRRWQTAERRLTTTEALFGSGSLGESVMLNSDEAIPILHASPSMQARIEDLLNKARYVPLSEVEEAELDAYAEVDDCLSVLNRVIRNIQEYV
jgi:hypothetical protein